MTNEQMQARQDKIDDNIKHGENSDDSYELVDYMKR